MNKEKPDLTLRVLSVITLLVLVGLAIFLCFLHNKAHLSQNSSQIIGWFKMDAEPTSQVFNNDVRIVTVYVKNTEINKGRMISAFVMDRNGASASTWQSIRGHWMHGDEVQLVSVLADRVRDDETYFAVGFRPSTQVATNR